jgi:hypothetical protein
MHSFILTKRRRTMEPSVRAVIESIHASRARAAMHVTGGGVRALGWLTSVPKCSRTLIDARVPYAREASREILKASTTSDSSVFESGKYVAADVAVALAEAAYANATRATPASVDARDVASTVGIGATCALTTEEVVKRGEHRCVVASKSMGRVMTYEMTLDKASGRGRAEEEACASRLVLRALHDEAWRMARDAGESDAMMCGEKSGEDLVRETLSEAEVRGMVVTAMSEEPAYAPSADPAAAVRRWLEDDSETSPAVLEFTGGVLTAVGATRADFVLSGSFNPLHDGHRQLLDAATASSSEAEAVGAYEIGVTNADKGTLTVEEIIRRLHQFTSPRDVCLLTKTPLFVDKTRALPGVTFVVGVDTAVRLLDPKYYGGSERALAESFDTVRANACDFLVAGRLDPATNVFIDADALDVPLGLSRLFRTVPGFRNDLSSTAIRRRAAGGNEIDKDER